MALVVMNPSASAGDTRDTSSIPGSGNPLQEEMATHSSILAWRIPWTEEPGRLQSIGLQRVGHDWSDLACSTCIVACPGFIDIFTYLVSLKKVIRIKKNYFPVCTKVTFCCLFSSFPFLSLSFLKWLLVLDCQFIFMNDDQFNRCKWIPFTL